MVYGYTLVNVGRVKYYPWIMCIGDESRDFKSIIYLKYF